MVDFIEYQTENEANKKVGHEEHILVHSINGMIKYIPKSGINIIEAVVLTHYIGADLW
jgi:hypothetical protein